MIKEAPHVLDNYINIIGIIVLYVIYNWRKRTDYIYIKDDGVPVYSCNQPRVSFLFMCRDLGLAYGFRGMLP